VRNNFWNGKRVFITGANGFVGSWLTKALIDQRVKVSVLINQEVKGSLLNEVRSNLTAVFNGNLTNFSLIKKIFDRQKPEICFHLAAQPIVTKANNSPIPTLKTNIEGTWNILEAARVNNTPRLIVASSDKAYGVHKNLPYTEKFSLNAFHPYDASKACCDILAQTYYHTYRMSLAVTRCANIYGFGDNNFSRIVPATVRDALRGKRPIIRSDGTPLRDYIYISDVVKAYLVLAQRLGDAKIDGQAFNFGTGKPVSVINLVRKIINLSGKKGLTPRILSKNKIKGEIDKQYLNSSKAQKALNWKPKLTLDQGLKLTIKGYKTFFEK